MGCGGQAARVFARWVFAGILILCAVIPSGADDAKPQELILLTWEDYLDPGVAGEFEAEYHAKIREVHFESDNDRDLMLVQQQGEGFDLALVDAAAVAVYDRKDWLLPLREKDIPNLRNIDPALWDLYPGLAGKAVPYTQGTMGIIYRTDLVPEPITSWMQLFRPVEALRGKIMMAKDPYDLIGAAMKALGHPLLSEAPADMDQAEELLLAQKPSVARYGYFDLGPKSELVTGQVVAAQAFNGDFYAVQKYQKNLAYVIPSEGGGIWMDAWALLKASHHRRLALEFLDFLNRPEVAARNADGIYFATCNLAARAHLSREFLDDAVINPPPESLKRSDRYSLPSAPAAARYNEIFYNVVE